MEAGSHFSESGGGEKQQSREVSIKDKIKIEPEMDLDPPEYISVAIKSEIPDSFEPESSCPTLPLKQTETIPPERVDVTIKTEALEGFVPELSPAPLTDKQQHEMELDPPEFINVAVKSEIPDSYEPETLTTQENEMYVNPTEYMDMTVKSESPDAAEPESICGLPSMVEEHGISKRNALLPQENIESNEQLSCLNRADYEDTNKNTPAHTNNDIDKISETKKVNHCTKKDDKIGNPSTEFYKIVKDLTKLPLIGRLSPEHEKCSLDHCSKYSQKDGLGQWYGGISYKKMCGLEIRSKISHNHDLFRTQGGNYSKGCSKQAFKGELCVAHGVGHNKVSSVECNTNCVVKDCFNRPRKKGLCTAHGGGHSHKKCIVENCLKQGRRGGLCTAHGGIVQSVV